VDRFTSNQDQNDQRPIPHIVAEFLPFSTFNIDVIVIPVLKRQFFLHI